MALNTAQLTIDLTDFLSDLPGTEADCAQAWAEILGDYTALIVPPVPPLAHSAAVLTLQGALLGMAVPGAALGVFQAALAAFATAAAALRPGASLSGHTATRRPRSGVQSARPTALHPPCQVTATCDGNSRAAASADFSPSTTSTGASVRAARACSP